EMTAPTMGVPPAGDDAARASDSAVAWTALAGASSTIGAESTPHCPSALKSDRPTDAAVARRPENRASSGLTVTSHFEGCAESARTGLALQSAMLCTPGRLHAMLPLRSTTKRMLAGTCCDV